jgi:hypothetical protein
MKSGKCELTGFFIWSIQEGEEVKQNQLVTEAALTGYETEEDQLTDDDMLIIDEPDKPEVDAAG